MHRILPQFLLLLSLLAAGLTTASADIVFRLPTDNSALFEQKYDDFYMYVDRNFEGVKSKPWQGGTYGFTRTPIRMQAGVIETKFHEGIDVKPLKRTADGTPLDPVRPCAPGRVVHVCDNPTHSSYGRYVVIEHRLTDGPLYSLYAHLASTNCKPGDRVGTANVIGVLGFSGVGLNKERSHLHLEFCMLISEKFQDWYDMLKIASPNRHGIYNGLNLIGMDPADILVMCKEGKRFSLSSYLASQPFQYKVRIPAKGALEIVKRYPFLLRSGPANPASWEIAFAGSGLPLSVTPSQVACSQPVVFEAVPLPYSQRYKTLSRVDGSSKAPVLTSSGLNYIKLFQ